MIERRKFLVSEVFLFYFMFCVSVEFFLFFRNMGDYGFFMYFMRNRFLKVEYNFFDEIFCILVGLKKYSDD